VASSHSSARSATRNPSRPARAKRPRVKPDGETRVRVGCETPRIWTPPRGELHDNVFGAFGEIKVKANTRGFEAIRFAEDVLGIRLLPWQKWLLIHALEINDDGTFRFRVVILLVARQNGKSTLMQVLTLWRMYVDRAPLVIGTAQSLDIAEDQWAGAVDIAEAVPELAAEIKQVSQVNGGKRLVLTGKQQYRVKAATRRGARGLSGDLVLLDELREHQVWDAWASVTKTTMARPYAQVWGASNAGDVSSVVLRFLRALGHRALGYPDGTEGIAEGLSLSTDEDEPIAEEVLAALESLAIFEWSAPPGASVWDRDAWAQANPSMGPLDLGYTILESTIASAAATDPEWVFRTEVMCQFVAHSAVGPFPTGSWEATLDLPHARSARGAYRDVGRPATYCVDVSHDRTMAYVAVAFWDTEGRVRFQVIAKRAGTDWVIPWLLSTDRTIPVESVTFQSKGAAVSSLAEAFAKAEIPVIPWEGSNLGAWYGMFFDRIAMSVDPENPLVVITHSTQPILDVAANSAETKALGGDGLMIDRKNSPRDAAPLVACIGAVGALLTLPEVERSAYDDHDLMVV
jgi:hypothetical protein